MRHEEFFFAKKRNRTGVSSSIAQFVDKNQHIVNMKVIGLTGGMGSGKSIIARIFGSMGIPVFDSDQVAKELYHTDDLLKSQVKNLFGADIYQDGRLDRKRLAEVVFHDTARLKQLTDLVHPAVKRAFEDWKKSLPKHTPYLIREAAILFESGSDKDCDAVITVNAPEALRIERVKRRDGADEESIRERLSKQWTDEQRVAKANEVIINDNVHAVLPRIVDLDGRWRSSITSQQRMS